MNQIHSTRLRKSALNPEDLTGIATRCDIVIVQDRILYLNEDPQKQSSFPCSWKNHSNY